jgi:hypothetical protein
MRVGISAQIDWYREETGAGEGIRTLDPDLGKIGTAKQTR